jgi:predicted O-methyltransferase YrrM
MKGAPNWHGVRDIVDPAWKVELLRWLGSICKLRTLVETGTCHGATSFALQKDFDKIYTIELHDGFYELSRQKFQSVDNIFIYHGSSPDMLQKLLPTLPPGPLLFWLDAHTSGPHTAQGDPLAEEMKVISDLRPDSLVVIDDESNAQLLRVPESTLDGWTGEYRTGEVIMQRGGFTIPPFED